MNNIDNLTEEQIKFLREVCHNHSGNCYWNLNRYGNVDVYGSVDMEGINLTEIPVKFGRVEGGFNCSKNQLTSLKNIPNYISTSFDCSHNQLTSLKTPYLRFGSTFSNITDFRFEGNPLTDYFKITKRRDFKYWNRLDWNSVLSEYPFLINIGKKYFGRNYLKKIVDSHPQTKLYLKS